MVESYNIGMEAHDSYAHRQQQLERYAEEYRVSPDKAGVVAQQTSVLRLRPDEPKVVILLKLNKRKRWADYESPPDYYKRRRTSSYVAPSLGGKEKLDAQMQNIMTVLRQNEGFSDTEENPGHTILQLLAEIRNTNDMVDEVHARMKQFMQG